MPGRGETVLSRAGRAVGFAEPRGWLAGLTGQVMAFSNAGMNQQAADRLQVEAGQSVLEVGFGPGRLIAALTARAGDGTVSGVDVSEAMVSEARARNRRAIQRGRVSLHRASVENLPFEAASFDRACSVNSFHLWPDQDAGLAELLRVLAPGGRLLLGIRGRDPGRRRMFDGIALTTRRLDAAEQMVRAAGFRRVDVESVHVRLMFAVFLAAER